MTKKRLPKELRLAVEAICNLPPKQVETFISILGFGWGVECFAVLLDSRGYGVPRKWTAPHTIEEASARRDAEYAAERAAWNAEMGRENAERKAAR